MLHLQLTHKARPFDTKADALTWFLSGILFLLVFMVFMLFSLVLI